MLQGKLIIMHEMVCACVWVGEVRGHDAAGQAHHPHEKVCVHACGWGA